MALWATESRYFDTGTQNEFPLLSFSSIQLFWPVVAGPELPIVPSVAVEPPPNAVSE